MRSGALKDSTHRAADDISPAPWFRVSFRLASHRRPSARRGQLIHTIQPIHSAQSIELPSPVGLVF